MAKPAKKPATYVAQGITALGRSKTYKRRGEGHWFFSMARLQAAKGADARRPPCNAEQVAAMAASVVSDRGG